METVSLSTPQLSTHQYFCYNQGDMKKIWPLWLIIVSAGILAYHNSLAVPFIFDDLSIIVENEQIRSLKPLWAPLFGTTRPALYFSLAVNHAIGNLRVEGYHLVNLTLHLLTALALFGVTHRALTRIPRNPSRSDFNPLGMSFAVALLWVVHPLNTQGVTYLIQRSESGMALCYLMTLYGTLRGAEAVRPLRWHLLALFSFVLGMGFKPSMLTAPFAVWLCDRIFPSVTFRQATEQRQWLYIGFAITGLLYAGLYLTTTDRLQTGAGALVKDLSVWSYALTQPGVILHYLRLALWPHPLVLDYGWPPVETVGEAWLPSLLLVGLGLATLWALRRGFKAAFLGLWLFLTLLPTSSFFPLQDLAFEHRMYLPLMAVVAGVVFAARQGLLLLFPSPGKSSQAMALGLLVLATVALGACTIRRNADYRSVISIWSDVIAKRPGNARGHYNLGRALVEEGRLEEAKRLFIRALELEPKHSYAHNNLGSLLAQQGRFKEAVFHFKEAAQLDPHNAAAQKNLDLALKKL